MRRILALLCLALPLSACIDADVTVDFKDAETVEMVSSHSMTRQLFDMAGKSPEESCENGKPTLTTDKFTCEMTQSMTVDAFIAEANQSAASAENPEEQIREAMKVERLDDNRLRLTLDMSDAMSGNPDAAEMKEMAAMMRAALAGHSIVMRIRAPKIEETTGTLSEDGKQAEYVLPLTALLEDTAPAAFITTVSLKSCTFGIFC